MDKKSQLFINVLKMSSYDVFSYNVLLVIKKNIIQKPKAQNTGRKYLTLLIPKTIMPQKNSATKEMPQDSLHGWKTTCPQATQTLFITMY